MTVLYFQILIIISILLIAFFKRKYLFHITIFWTIESLLLLTTLSPLSFVQLLVIWFTYYYAKDYYKKKDLINKLIEITNQYDESSKNNFLKYANSKNIESIVGKEHYEYLLSSLAKSTTDIIILSGWISDYVIDERFIKILKNKMKEGLNIFIGYGYRDKDNNHLNNTHTDNALNNLRQLWIEAKKSQFKGNIYVSNFPNHQKILIHNNVIVVGSANWLSNKSYTNEEYSVIINSNILVEKEILRIRTNIKENNKNYNNLEF
jgi:predicted MPP superfamily phosphohydrolase